MLCILLLLVQCNTLHPSAVVLLCAVSCYEYSVAASHHEVSGYLVVLLFFLVLCITPSSSLVLCTCG